MQEIIALLLEAVQTGAIEVNQLTIQFTLFSCDLDRPVDGQRTIPKAEYTDATDLLDELWNSSNLTFLD